MEREHIAKTTKILGDLIKQYKSMREFARTIDEDAADLSHWHMGHRAVTTRAIVSICRVHPEIKPHDLRPEYFPEDIEFVFNKKVKK